jgi:hypothetical protein
MLALCSCDRPPDMSVSTDAARAGLERALGAWRDGKPQAGLLESDPPIQVVDSEWAGGRKLADFEVVGEAPSGAEKRFNVKLSFASPKAQVEERFVVLGTRPMAVFREADYDRSMNMDNAPTPKKKR